MIDVVTKSEGIIAGLINRGRKEGMKDGRKEGRKEGERNIILRLLENQSIEEVSEMIGIEESEIRRIIQN